MKAITIKEKGSLNNLNLEDLPVPSIQSNEVLVRIKAASINPVDWKGVIHGIFHMPYILGSDISGIVEQVGPEITKFKVGDEVIGSLEWSKQGAFAEFVATKEEYLVLKPTNLNFAEAAAIPLAALTAWQGLFDVLNLQAGQKIFIQATAGGVGLYALQMAKWKGAYVIASSSEKNVDFLKSLGADEVIDYNKADFSEILTGIDAVFDSVASSEKSFKVLKKGGKYVSITAYPSLELAVSYFVTATRFLFHANTGQLQQIVDLVGQGKVKIFIDKTFPLADAKTALEYLKTGHSKGKNILIMD